MVKSWLQLLVGAALVVCGAMLILNNFLNKANAQCTPCTATPACNNCPPFTPDEGKICRDAEERIESTALTGECIDDPEEPFPIPCMTDPNNNCSGSGTTGWTNAWCASGEDDDVCTMITTKKVTHQWQAYCTGGLDCPCTAVFLNEEGCECVVVCAD